MAFGHGKDTAFWIDTVGDVLTDISTYLTSVNFNTPSGTADTTTFGAAVKDYIPGLKDGTISIEGNFDPTVHAILAGIEGQVAGDYEYGPQGGGGGAVKRSGAALCTAYNVNTPVGDKVTFTAEFQMNSAVTEGTF